ncbi:MAG TPA: ATP-binding protein [Gaiellaceae bacterium]|nr:ATP-binding protein [Gaiellaceae bacterium]
MSDRSYEQLRTSFTAAVSHELRTPLARILALLESAALPGADVQALVARARDEAERAGELIDDILFLAELDGGDAAAQEPVRALPVLRSVAAGLDGAAARAGVRIVVEGDEDAELPLGDRLLRVVVENLATNAIHHAGHGSTLTLSARAGELVAADDGVGVGPEHLPRLFERFYRADSARSSPGSGLGLAIVKHAVAAAGGTVEAESRRGAGVAIRCTFTTS